MLGRDPDETDVEAHLVEQPDHSDRTWRVLCEAFLEKMALEGSNPRTVAAIRNKLEKTWPTLGDRVGDEIDPPDLLAVCKDVEAKGNYETANRIRSAAGRVCRYAMASGLMTRNFSDGLQGALVQPQKQGFPAITEPNEVGELLRAVWDYKWGLHHHLRPEADSHDVASLERAPGSPLDRDRLGRAPVDRAGRPHEDAPQTPCATVAPGS